MGAVTTPHIDRVSSVFDDLGYTVSGTGPRLTAERKWRVVTISLGKPETIPDDGDFHCFVVTNGEASDVYREIAVANPDYEWAVMRMDDDGEVEFLRPSVGDEDPIVT